MAKIALRAYNSEIDRLIDNKQSPEAIAHCKQILKHFPKHIDTYRLLGKAYLELQRYSEASDILQRVLSVIPDDFISQIGMSVVREDEGNLDASLYHMERAFEVQPANPAIQDELRRVYGRRDGVEPPKIRLTRGALVRLYTRGELYPQAIAEANAALAEDPQRLDLQIALARLYNLSGQKVQAVEICSKLVARLPYCFEANRILADVLPGTSRADDAKIYQERVSALDPYAGMIGEHARTAADVPDNAVQVERLEYQPGQEEAEQPEWTRNIGVAWESETADKSLPDWMSGTEESQTPPTMDLEAESDLALPGLSEPEAAEIPDWMAAAGWSPSDGMETPPPPLVDSVTAEIEDTEEGLASPAEIPDWLQAMSPDGTLPQESENTAEDTAWLDGLLGKSESEAVEESSEQKEYDQEITPLGTVEAAAAEELPSWLNEPLIGEEITSAPQSEIPDWLQSPADSDLTAPLEDVTPVGEKDIEDVAHFGETDIEEGAIVDNDVTDVAARLPQPDSSSVLGEVESPEVEPEIEPAISLAEISPETAQSQPEDDMDAAMAWLESLAAKQGADEATLGTSEEERNVEMPDWLKQEAAASPDSVESLEIPPVTSEFPVIEESAVEELPAEAIAEHENISLVESVETQTQDLDLETRIVEPAAEEPETPLQEVSTIVEDEFDSVLPEDVRVTDDEVANAVPLAGEDMDDTFAWLESLAARQGAEEGTLLVDANERPETPPEWVSEAVEEAAAATEPPVTEQEPSLPVVESTPPDIQPVSEWQAESPEPEEAEAPLPDWLQDIDEYTRAEREVEPEKASEEALPEWLQGLENMVEEGEEEAFEAAPALTQSAAEWKPEDTAVELSEEARAVSDLEAALQELETQSAAAVTDEHREEQQTVVDETQPVPVAKGIEVVEGKPLVDLLTTAQQAMSKGEIDTALVYFNKLISENAMLEETIHDLRDASYRYPVNSDIWQALGDAYSRGNRIQEALDAYTKAEELFR